MCGVGQTPKKVFACLASNRWRQLIVSVIPSFLIPDLLEVMTLSGAL